jgi:hypothetical protein
VQVQGAVQRECCKVANLGGDNLPCEDFVLGSSVTKIMRCTVIAGSFASKEAIN